MTFDAARDLARRRSPAWPRLERELLQAVADEAFELRYQPVVTMANGRVVGVEALIHWVHPERGLIGPDEFISVAEDTGIIIPIGEWVLWEACLQVARWTQQHGIELEVAIELSARQLASSTLIATVSDVLDTTGIDPSRVCFAVAESAVIDDPELAIANLQALRDLGLATTLRDLGLAVTLRDLALRDFGIGDASLRYLRTLPVTSIKIDRSVTAGLGVDDTIIESTIALAHELDLAVVAEGIERSDHYATLRAFGCDFGQGDLLGRPMTADAVIERYFAPVDPAFEAGPTSTSVDRSWSATLHQ